MKYSFKIGHYVVTRIAYEVSDPADPGAEGRITLIPHADYDGPINQGVLYFRGPFFGDLPATSTVQAVRAILPRTEFADWYRVLRTESPVFLHWELKDENTLSILSLATTEEPVGEGFDQSL